MLNFSRSECDPLCLQSRQQNNLPHDSVWSWSRIFESHITVTEFSFRNTLPFHSGKTKNSIWINFNFSMSAYFRTFEVFIIKFISTSVFSIFLCKNILVYIFFFLEEENLNHLWSKYQVKQIPKLQLGPDRILAQYVPKTSFVYHDMKEKQIYVEITNTEITMKPIMLPQWDINILNFNHAN